MSWAPSFFFDTRRRGPGQRREMPSSTEINMRQAKTMRDDGRFLQLMALADEGDESARADLFREYGYEYGRGNMEVRHDR